MVKAVNYTGAPGCLGQGYLLISSLNMPGKDTTVSFEWMNDWTPIFIGNYNYMNSTGARPDPG